MNKLYFLQNRSPRDFVKNSNAYCGMWGGSALSLFTFQCMLYSGIIFPDRAYNVTHAGSLREIGNCRKNPNPEDK